MFERFTPGARSLVVAAQRHANLHEHSFIYREHLLLATLEVADTEPDGVCGLIFMGGGAPPEALRELILAALERRETEEREADPEVAGRGSQPFTAASKKVLELSLREALQLGHNYIDTEHLLLGLLCESEGVAAQVSTLTDLRPRSTGSTASSWLKSRADSR